MLPPEEEIFPVYSSGGLDAQSIDLTEFDALLLL
jgi:hypothetical protein